MPTTAAAALSKIAREIGCSPRMSTTECMTIVSVSPMNGANSRRPDALGVTISFGTPTGQRVHRARAHQPALGAAEAERAVEPALARTARRQTARTPASMRSTAAPREPAARTPSSVVARRGCHLRVRDVGRDARRLAEDPRVDHDRPRAERAQPVADVGDLVTLGVEGADQRDPGILRHGSAQAAAPTASIALRRRSIESWT